MAAREKRAPLYALGITDEQIDRARAWAEANPEQARACLSGPTAPDTQLIDRPAGLSREDAEKLVWHFHWLEEVLGAGSVSVTLEPVRAKLRRLAAPALSDTDNEGDG